MAAVSVVAISSTAVITFIGPWLIEVLFDDELTGRTMALLSASGGGLMLMLSLSLGLVALHHTRAAVVGFVTAVVVFPIALQFPDDPFLQVEIALLSATVSGSLVSGVLLRIELPGTGQRVNSPPAASGRLAVLLTDTHRRLDGRERECRHAQDRKPHDPIDHTEDEASVNVKVDQWAGRSDQASRTPSPPGTKRSLQKQLRQPRAQRLGKGQVESDCRQAQPGPLVSNQAISRPARQPRGESGRLLAQWMQTWRQRQLARQRRRRSRRCRAALLLRPQSPFPRPSRWLRARQGRGWRWPRRHRRRRRRLRTVPAPSPTGIVSLGCCGRNHGGFGCGSESGIGGDPCRNGELGRAEAGRCRDEGERNHRAPAQVADGEVGGLPGPENGGDEPHGGQSENRPPNVVRQWLCSSLSRAGRRS